MGSNCCKTSEIRNSVSFQVRPIINECELSINKPDLTAEKQSDQHLSIKPILWRKGNLIGSGPSGKSYQAMNEETGELLAVKIIKLSPHPHLAELHCSLLCRSIDVAKSLRHFNLIKYYQLDTSPDSATVCILVDYISGGSLRDLLFKYGHFSEPLIKNYTFQILKGLSHLHSQNLSHTNLKSTNILVTDDAAVKLSAFSCSKLLSASQSHYPSSNPPYTIGPEVLLSGASSCAADIWSLGCLVIEMATGQPAWSSLSTKPSEVAKLISKTEKLPSFPSLSADLTDLISKCLVRNPDLRPTAAQLLSHPSIVSFSTSYSHVYTSKTLSLNFASRKLSTP